MKDVMFGYRYTRDGIRAGVPGKYHIDFNKIFNIEPAELTFPVHPSEICSDGAGTTTEAAGQKCAEGPEEADESAYDQTEQASV